MDKNQYAYDASIIKLIKSIQFDMLGNNETRIMSALAGTNGIEVPDLYDKQEPKRGGLIDPRMGGQGNTLCATCQLDSKHCDGHSAHIDMAVPVFQILFLQYVKNILDCICIGCSKILIQKETAKLRQIFKIKSNKNRLVKIHELASKTKACTNCHMRVSKIKVDIKKSTSAINIYSETEAVEDEKGDIKKHRLNLTPEMISEIFDNVPIEDRKLLGMERSNPSDMIVKVFHVPSSHVRPSLRGFFSGGATMEDGLTHKIADIVKANIRINKQKENNNENTSKYAKDHAHLLQYHVATYYDPDIITVPKMDGKGANFKPLVARYRGKQGRIRGNLMGKRGDFNARTVITSDPTISTNFLGVPVKIAMNLTFPEIVTEYNIEEMTRLVRNGPDIYPGANYVFRNNINMPGASMKPIYLKFNKEEINLQYGDIVERHLQNGDIVLLNRQPTLHKQSMMGHRIKVINDDTLMT